MATMVYKPTITSITRGAPQPRPLRRRRHLRRRLHQAPGVEPGGLRATWWREIDGTWRRNHGNIYLYLSVYNVIYIYILYTYYTYIYTHYIYIYTLYIVFIYVYIYIYIYHPDIAVYVNK